MQIGTQAHTSMHYIYLHMCILAHLHIYKHTCTGMKVYTLVCVHPHKSICRYRHTSKYKLMLTSPVPSRT